MAGALEQRREHRRAARCGHRCRGARLLAGAAVVLEVVSRMGKQAFATDNLSAFGVFTFVEAAVLLTAGGGAVPRLGARSQRKGFHLPGGDGVVISLAGGWALLLLVWWLFDKPDVSDPGRPSGSSGACSAPCSRRARCSPRAPACAAVHRPEPPNPAAELGGATAALRAAPGPSAGRSRRGDRGARRASRTGPASRPSRRTEKKKKKKKGKGDGRAARAPGRAAQAGGGRRAQPRQGAGRRGAPGHGVRGEAVSRWTRSPRRRASARARSSGASATAPG